MNTHDIDTLIMIKNAEKEANILGINMEGNTFLGLFFNHV
jgi:hypothetical protein